MKPSNQDELLSYLSESLTALKAIRAILSQRNKTLRIRAMMSIIQIVEGRLDASWKFAKAGGYSEFTVQLQQLMYNPIVEYLAEEAAK